MSDNNQIQPLKLLAKREMKIEGYINPDGSLVLCVSIFENNGWRHWHNLPFSEFADKYSTIDELIDIVKNKYGYAGGNYDTNSR